MSDEKKDRVFYAKVVASYLDYKKIIVDIRKTDQLIAFFFSLPVKYKIGVDPILGISVDDNGETAIMSNNIKENISKEKWPILLKIINDIHDEAMWSKYYIDKRGSLAVGWTFFLPDDTDAACKTMMNTFNAFVYELERFLPRLDV